MSQAGHLLLLCVLSILCIQCSDAPGRRKGDQRLLDDSEFEDTHPEHRVVRTRSYTPPFRGPKPFAFGNESRDNSNSSFLADIHASKELSINIYDTDSNRTPTNTSSVRSQVNISSSGNKSTNHSDFVNLVKKRKEIQQKHKRYKPRGVPWYERFKLLIIFILAGIGIIILHVVAGSV